MRKPPLGHAVMGAALLLISCGSSSGQTGGGGNGGGAGNGGGGRAGSGAAGGVGGQTGGTGGGGASCAPVSACGGDIVGTWKVTQSCSTATQDLSSTCAGASATYEFMYSGTVTYNADLTYSSALAVTGNVHEHFPSGCNPFGFTCAELMQAAVDAGVPDNCSADATGACNCDGVLPFTSANTPGTYSTSGGMLTTISGSTTSTNLYCVQGGVLHEMAGPGDGGLTATGGIVLTKQ